mgnify:CR=1 FL=1|tara:strand:- start:631 stop:2421 length:1791 start_codon:yes stop_codon:yes gene_type:complete
MVEEIEVNVKSNIQSVTKNTDELATSLKEANANVGNLNENLKIQNGVINTLEKDLIKMEAKLREIPKNTQGFHRLEKAIKATKDEIKLEKIGLKELNTEMKDATKTQKKLSAASGKVTKATKKQSQFTKGLSRAFRGFSIIGIVITAFNYLRQALQGNETIMNAVSKVTNSITNVMSDLVSVLTDTFTWVMASSERFDGLGKVLKAVVTLGINPLKMAFYILKLGIQELLLAWEKSPLGSRDTSAIAEQMGAIRETRKTIDELADGVIDAGKAIYNNIGDAINEIVDLTKHAGKGLADVIDAGFDTTKRLTAEEIAEAKKLAAEKIQIAKDAAADAAAALKELRDANAANELEDERKQALALLEIQKQKDLDSLREHENFLLLKAEIDKKYGMLEAEINKEFDEADKLSAEDLEDFKNELKMKAFNAIGAHLDASMDELEGNYSKEKRLAEANGQDTTAIDEKYEKKREKLAQQQKVFKVAEALITTYQMANAAYLAGSQLGPAGIVMGPLAAAAALAAGLANVRSIMAQDVGGGGGGGGAGGGGGTAATPAPEMMSGAFTLSGGQEVEPARAYVVSDDITNNQNKLAIIRRRATI